MRQVQCDLFQKSFFLHYLLTVTCKTCHIIFFKLVGRLQFQLPVRTFPIKKIYIFLNEQLKKSRPFFLLSLFRSLPTGFFMPRFYPQNRKHLQQYHRPDREQTENGKISIFRCVLHRSSQNSLFGQVAGPFQEIISQPHREQDFTVPPIS